MLIFLLALNIEVASKINEELRNALDPKELESFARQIACGMVSHLFLETSWCVSSLAVRIILNWYHTRNLVPRVVDVALCVTKAVRKSLMMSKRFYSSW